MTYKHCFIIILRLVRYEALSFRGDLSINHACCNYCT